MIIADAGSLDEDLRALAERHEVPGVSVAVAQGDHVTEATFGVINTRTGEAVSPDTLFMIQSITKIITATLVMQLVDDGLIDLDDRVRSVLPEFRTDDADVSGRVTIRHLLSHTGGFEGDLWAPTTSGDDALERFVADLVPTAGQFSPPGDQFSYCNAGFGVLGRLVEVLRSDTYEGAVRRHLTEPLGIEELAFSADQGLAFRTAIGHVRPTPGTDLRPLRSWAVMPPSNPAAGNQLAMSARGLLAVAQMHLADGRAPDGSPVLSSHSARLMRVQQIAHPAALGASSAHGLGWWLDGERLAHDGGSPGVAAALQIWPRRGLAAVVLANSEAGHAVASALLRPLFADQPRDTVDPSDRVATPPDRPEDVQNLTGRYEIRQCTVGVTAADAELWCRIVPRHEAVDMAVLAGTVVAPELYRLAHRTGRVYALLNDKQAEVGTVEFLGRDDQGRARFLFRGGRAIPRTVLGRPC